MRKLLNKILGSLYGHSSNAYYNIQYQFFRKKYNITSNFKFNGTDIRIYGEGEIILDNNSYIGSYSTIQLSLDHRVKIGHSCLISHNVRIYTSTADPDQNFMEKRIKPPITGDINIGNGVWIGANVFINPGINIGDNSVIGANSVVTKDVPANAIYGGVPAKLIRYKSNDDQSN